MKLIKIDECIYTIDKKFRVPNNNELKCRLASHTHPEVFDVNKSFLTDAVTEADYEVEGDQVRIAFPLNDVITEIFIDLGTGDVKVQFDYLPDEYVKTEVVKFLDGILKPTYTRYCDYIRCRYKYQSTITGVFGRVYWNRLFILYHLFNMFIVNFPLYWNI
jgi:hypothetical protein